MPSTPRSRKLLDPHTRNKLVAELRAGPTRREALERLQISESTFYRELERSDELRALVNRNGDPTGNGHRRGDASTSPPKPARSVRNGGKRRDSDDASEPGGAPRDHSGAAPELTDASSPAAGLPEESVMAADTVPGKRSKAPKGMKVAKGAPEPDKKRRSRKHADEPHSGERPARRKPPRRPDSAVNAGDEGQGLVAATSTAVRTRKPRGVSVAPGQEREALASISAQSVATPASRPPSVSLPKTGRAPRSRATTDVTKSKAARRSTARATPSTQRPRTAGSQQAYWLPPVIVLAAEIVVGLVVGASPLVLLLVTGSMVAVLYVVRRWGSSTASPTKRPGRQRVARQETSWPPPAVTSYRAAPIGPAAKIDQVARMAIPAPAPQPTPLPIESPTPAAAPIPARRTGAIFRARSRTPAAVEEAPSSEVEPQRNDLRWLWNSIGRDPRPPRPPRRDGR